MPFPSTGILDSFGGTLSGWTNSVFGDGALTIVSGKAQGPSSGNWGSAVWDGFMEADFEVGITIDPWSTTNLAVWGLVTDWSASPTGYLVFISGGASSFKIMKAIGGSFSDISSEYFPIAIQTGDQLRFRGVAGNLEVWYRYVGGPWKRVISIFDDDISGPGKIGLGVQGTVASVDDFSGGSPVVDTFPQTLVLEPFTGSGALSGDWTAPAYTGDSTPERYLDNCVTANGTYGSALYDAEEFGVDQESFCTIPSAATGTASVILWCKIKNPNTGSGVNYSALYSVDNDTITIIRQYTGIDAELVSSEPFTLAPGVDVGMRVLVGDTDITIELWVDSGSGFELRLSCTDAGAVSTYPLLASTGGYVGFAFYGEGLSLTRCIDDFGGGTYSLLDMLLPDADIVTTGWTTAPLFSKVNDASDATVIQATAV